MTPNGASSKHEEIFRDQAKRQAGIEDEGTTTYVSKEFEDGEDPGLIIDED